MRIRSFRFTLFLTLGFIVLAGVPASALKGPVEKPIVPDFDEDVFFTRGSGVDQPEGFGQFEEEAAANEATLAIATLSWSDLMLRDLRDLKLAWSLVWKVRILP